MKSYITYILVVSLVLLGYTQNSYALGTLTSSAGTEIVCSEEIAGFTITAPLLPNGILSAAALDTFELLLDGSSFPTTLSTTLDASDILAGEVVFTIPSGQLGSNGAKSITSQLTKNISLLTETSSALTLTLDCVLGKEGGSLSATSIKKASLFESLKPVFNFVHGPTNTVHTDLSSTIETQYITIGEPFDISLQFPSEPSRFVEKVQLYMNLIEPKHHLHESDTYIQYKIDEPLIIADPHGYFSNVDVKSESENGISNFKFSITFDKIMEKQKLIMQYMDSGTNYKIVEFPDALKVDDNTEALTQTIKTTEEPELGTLDSIVLNDLNVADNNIESLIQTLKTIEELELETLDNIIQDIFQVSVSEKLDPIQMGNLRVKLGELKETQINAINQLNIERVDIVDYSLLLLLISDNPEETAKKLGLQYKNGIVTVIVEVSEIEPEILQLLQTFGKINFVSDGFAQMNLDLNKLSDLTDINQVQHILIPHTTLQNEHTLSELEYINAHWLPIAGITGNGVKVAIIDFAFDLKNPKISPNIDQAKSFRYDTDGSTFSISGSGKSNQHGTSVAEIIVDTAPDAKLFLYTIGNEYEFVTALKDAVENEVDIITVPLGWTHLSTDGTSYITNNVNIATSKGSIVVVSAGNFALKHWEGEYRDTNLNGWHEFVENDEGLTFSITPSRIKNNIPIHVNLLWDNTNVDAADFDMILLNPSKEIVSFSTNVQDTDNDTFFEQIIYYPDEAGNYSLGIIRDGIINNNVPIEIFSINDVLEHKIQAGSVLVPTDATDVIVTGAVNITSGKMELFSSQGPTNNGYVVPDVLAPNGIHTIAHENKLFYGTSAAAPYVAGTIALSLEVDPSISPKEILQNLQKNLPPRSSEICINAEHCNILDADLIIPWEKLANTGR